MKSLFLSVRLAGICLAGVATIASATCAHAQASTDTRPPQFVLLAFDGSQALPMWEETRSFAKQMEAEGKPLHFTYFISGVYYVERQYKAMYTEPTRGSGVSAIGWGKGDDDLLGRYDQTNLAFKEGNEIGSHVNAHFDGGKWTPDQWLSEFAQFEDIIFNFFSINKLQPTHKFPGGWLFSKKDIVGFRAPLLAWNKGTQQALKQYGFRYDTSQVKEMKYWPHKQLVSGAWNFPLAEVKIAGTGKNTLSMDYNFYYTQSKGVPDTAHAKLYEEQMYQTYIKYFQSNYSGNRAPVNIGHHFSKWNGGAYWNAMQRFAKAVCGLPEVRCVTYRELADFMDGVDAPTLAAYQAGNFPKSQAMIQAANLKTARTYDVAVQVSEVEPGIFDMKLTGDDVELLKKDPSVTIETSVGDGGVSKSVVLTHNQVSVADLNSPSTTIKLRIMKNGREILSHTRSVTNPGQADQELSSSADEDRSLLGDLPEAHMGEDQADEGTQQ